MERKTLFRTEAIQHLRTKWLGKALLTSGYPAWTVAVVSLFFFTLLIVAIAFGTYTRRINVMGEVITQPHAITIFSPQQGFITASFAHTGDKVRKGDRLYQLDVSRVSVSGNVSTKATEAIANQLKITENIIEKIEQNKAQTLKNLQRQLDAYRHAYEKSQSLIANAGKGLDEMRRSMKDYNGYLKRGLINKEQYNNQRYLYYQQQSAWQSLNSQIIQEGLQITNLESELSTRAAEYDNQISQYRYQHSDLQRQLAEVDASGTLFINSPSDGRLENLSVTEGQMVNAGDSLAQIAPASGERYSLVMWLPNSSVPYVSPGDSINIRYEAFPYEKYGQFPGKIVSVAAVPASPQEIAKYNSVALREGYIPEPYYKVIVSLKTGAYSYKGKPLPLSSGMKAESTLFLEKRPLYQWMLSPYYDIRKSIGGPVNE